MLVPHSHSASSRLQPSASSTHALAPVTAAPAGRSRQLDHEQGALIAHVDSSSETQVALAFDPAHRIEAHRAGFQKLFAIEPRIGVLVRRSRSPWAYHEAGARAARWRRRASARLKSLVGDFRRHWRVGRNLLSLSRVPARAIDLSWRANSSMRRFIGCHPFRQITSSYTDVVRATAARSQPGACRRRSP